MKNILRIAITIFSIGYLSACAQVITSTSKNMELQRTSQQSKIVNNNNGTLTQKFIDNKIMWLQDSNCISTNYPDEFKQYISTVGILPGAPTFAAFPYQEAKQFIDSMNKGKYPKCNLGYSDWRLPTIEELNSLSGYGRLVLLSREENSIFKNVYPNAYFYWSSSTAPDLGDKIWAWQIKAYGSAFEPPFFVFAYSPDNKCAVWPVRDIRD